nr:MAG TPA: hypothetical protein [Caudoviricetes sp.]
MTAEDVLRNIHSLRSTSSLYINRPIEKLAAEYR